MIHHAVILVALLAIASITGCLVPAFYDWTGADQSRPSPWMWYVPAGLTLIAIVCCASMPWIPVQSWPRLPSNLRSHFHLRSLLILTALTALALAIGRSYPPGVSGTLYLLALGAALTSAVRHREHRLPIAVLFGCMILPLAWILGYEQLDLLSPSTVWLAAGIPGFLPMALLASLFRANPHQLGWLAILITAGLITLGLCLIRLGAKPTIAYLLFVLLLSLVSSLALHAAVRA